MTFTTIDDELDFVRRSDTNEATSQLHVAVVGLGYVGLPTALMLMANGVQVTGVDVSEVRIASIRSSHVDLIPTDLHRLSLALQDEILHMTSDARAIKEADAVLICVPTPVDEHLVPDLRALESACKSVVNNARTGQTIILTSTSYVGTTKELLVNPLKERGFVVGEDIYIAFSPERIDPGNTSFTQEVVPRVVGGYTIQCANRADRIVSQVAPSVHLVASLEAAEFTKLYENTFRAVNIAFANEMADVATHLGLDVTEVIDAASTKPYGFMAFRPGPGVGGHCVPCDPHYLLWQLKRTRMSMPLVDQAMALIAQRPNQVVRRAIEILGNAGRSISGARVLVLGVAYKAGVQDVRESPALEIIERLKHHDAEVSYSDDYVPEIVIDGQVMRSVAHNSAPWDLVLVHTLHPEVDMAWLTNFRVLDAAFALPDFAGRIEL